MGLPSKPAATRARRNKTSTNATLRKPEPGDVEVPELPDSGTEWHALTRAWWIDIWASPMAPEYDDSDIHGLYLLAVLVNDFWTCKSASARQDASAEIRLQSIRYGLSPIDRRRLQWEIEKTKDAQAKGRRRDSDGPSSLPTAEPPRTDVDPRSILRQVN